MGGPSELNVPKGIWSPAGGFFADPKRWRRNTAIIAVGMVLLAIPVFKSSVANEQRYGVPHHSIPSQKWTPEKNFHSK